MTAVAKARSKRRSILRAVYLARKPNKTVSETLATYKPPRHVSVQITNMGIWGRS